MKYILGTARKYLGKNPDLSEKNKNCIIFLTKKL